MRVFYPGQTALGKTLMTYAEPGYPETHYEIVGKTLPSPSDPIVLVRAQEGVLKRAIAHQVANHVQWSAEP